MFISELPAAAPSIGIVNAGDAAGMRVLGRRQNAARFFLLLSAIGEAAINQGLLSSAGTSNETGADLAGYRIRGLPAALLSVMVSTALSGCGSITAETGTSALVAPGRYDVYTCADIDRQVQASQKRKAELEQLMGRASEGAGGAIASTIAYRGEYLQTRDELGELSHASGVLSTANGRAAARCSERTSQVSEPLPRGLRPGSYKDRITFR